MKYMKIYLHCPRNQQNNGNDLFKYAIVEEVGWFSTTASFLVSANRFYYPWILIRKETDKKSKVLTKLMDGVIGNTHPRLMGRHINNIISSPRQRVEGYHQYTSYFSFKDRTMIDSVARVRENEPIRRYGIIRLGKVYSIKKKIQKTCKKIKKLLTI